MIGNKPTGEPKVDDVPINGLLGVENSLGYKVHEIEKHLHNTEKWFGLAAVPVAETHRADRMSGTILPFQLVAGNNDFGAFVQIMGSDDTPAIAGMVKFDTHRFLVTSTNSTNAYIMQAVLGESADIAAKLAAGDYNEVPYISASNNNDSGINDILGERIPAGSKMWVRCACVGGNGTTIDFYFGIHEYEG